MHPTDRDEYIRRYEQRLAQYGYSPAALGWGALGRQDVRFSVLAGPALEDPECSVLDVGCGFADLHDYLRVGGWRGQYHGIDIVPGLLEVARSRRPELDLRLLDVSECEDDEYDVVIASGIFGARLTAEPNPPHIERTLITMLRLARRVACADFLSTHVDFQRPEAWHTDPSWAVQAAARIAPRFLLRHDYMPYEFALFLYRDAATSDRRVFAGYERQLRPERTVGP
jgi:SAM-dependent methyltransferase